MDPGASEAAPALRPSEVCPPHSCSASAGILTGLSDTPPEARAKGAATVEGHWGVILWLLPTCLGKFFLSISPDL